MTKAVVIKKLKSKASKKNLLGMKRFGISGAKMLGVSMLEVRKIAKEIKSDHQLALELWDSGIHEARILASIIADKKKINSQLMDSWSKDFDSWDICDQVCLNLFYASPLAYKKASVWAKRSKEFERRAGFALMAVLAFKEKNGQDKDFEAFFPLIIKYAADERNFVRKAVNWALRQIGKRNKKLNKKSILLAEKISQQTLKSAIWVAKDALRELRSPAVRSRL
ncbi:MAG: DNA alkylation repair protein [Patescibacteria group bacterium]|nr:DNA alkylation repair protein [Patescibacteria group bacterium]